MLSEADALERLTPDDLDPADQAGLATLALHVERYEFATRHARPGRLLDLACGVGYGTRLLGDRRPDLDEILGVDLSSEAVAYARARYAGDRIRFEVGDAMSWIDAEGFTTIVSLETIEHLPDPQRFFARLVGMLQAPGVLVASVPVTPSVDLNPHHLHDFSERSFRRLGAEHALEEIDVLPQVQGVNPLELKRGHRFQRRNLRPHLVRWYLHHPGALARRVGTLLRHGFANHYLTLAWRRTA